MELLKGLPVANAINEQIIRELESRQGRAPKLAVIRVGENPDDLSYEKGAVKKMEKLGLGCQVYVFPETVDNETFLREFDSINRDKEVTGILLLRPLPKHLDEKAVAERINPWKDLDGMSPFNQAKVYAGDESGFAPCTAEAVTEMLDYAGIDVTGKRVTVIGRSTVIGKPAAMLLMKRNATVTVCHTKTRDMEDICKSAEVLVAAAGSPRMVKKGFVAPGTAVIDVGINVDENGRLCGDVDTEQLEGIASLVTPVPGGVGSVTTSVLAKHLMRAAKMAMKQ